MKQPVRDISSVDRLKDDTLQIVKMKQPVRDISSVDRLKDDTLQIVKMKQPVRDISSVGRAIPCQGIGHQFEPDMSLQISVCF